MDDSIIIIGAGIAGLAAGCYAQMSGYHSRIFEMHNIPGGLCTAWERKEYLFDGCIHYLFGSAPGQPFHQLWEELGALQGREFVHHEELMRVSDSKGNTLIGYCDPDRLESHLIDISPEDNRLIKSFCDGIRVFTKFDLSTLQSKPKSMMTSQDWSEFGKKMLPFMLPLAQWGLVSAEQFARRFKNPFLQKAIPQLFAWPTIPTMVGMFLLAYMNNKNAGYPIGASLSFARSLEKRYLELGGEINYGAQVERILVEEDRAIGVKLYDNREFRAGRVISASDGRNTIFELLGEKYINQKIRRLYDGHLPIHSQIQVSIGVNRDFSSEPHWVTYLMDEPVQIAGEDRYEFGVKHYCFDPTTAPPGKSAVVLMMTTQYDYWQRIYGRRIYNEEQIQESETLINALERFYPGLKGDIEVTDVATPLSYERYTGNWQGSSCGWLLTRDTMMMMINGMQKTLPGLEKFYLVGQWVEPGGSVPVVAMSGRNAIQLICHEDRRSFSCTPNSIA